MAQRDPFRDLEELLGRMGRRMEETMGRRGEDAGRSSMNVDVADEGDEFVVTADVPGFARDDLDVKLVGKTLQISASREESSEQEHDQYIRRERHHRASNRAIELPDPVDDEDMSATYTNGVLTVRLHKAEQRSAGQSIEID